MHDLANQTSALYAAFVAYTLKPRIDGCPCCQLEKAERGLHARPLRQLTWKDFGVYPFKALTTFGDEADFRHFLPRLLELFLEDHQGAPYDVAQLFGKLNYARWRTWPAQEVAAVRVFVTAWLHLLSARAGDDAWELDELSEALRELETSGA